MFKNMRFKSNIKKLANAKKLKSKGKAIYALAKLGDTRAVEPLIKALGDSDVNLRMWSAYALGKLGDTRAVEPLIKALGDSERFVRESSAKALGRIRDTRAVEPLIKVLGDFEWIVRESSAEALGNLGDTRAVEPLIEALGEIIPDDRILLAEILNKLGEPKWKQCVTGADADIIRLGELGDKRAVGALVKTMLFLDSDFRRRSAEALDKLGEPIWKQYIKGDKDDFERLGNSHDPHVTAMLIKVLRHHDSNVRKHSAEVLGNLGDTRAVEPLIEALENPIEALQENPVSYVRWYFAEALGKLGDTRAVEPLIKALKASGKFEWAVRKHSAEALGKLGDTRAVEPLIAALGDSNSDCRKSSIVALGNLGDTRAVEPLIKILCNLNVNQVELREDSALALGKLGDKRAVETLIEALDYSNQLFLRLCRCSAEALGNLGDTRAVEPLLDVLGMALTAMENWRTLTLTDGSVDVTMMMDPRWYICLSSIKALGELGDKRAVNLLIKTSQSKHERIRETAVEALKKLEH